MLYAASWIVQLPRDALFAGALALSAGRACAVVALAGLVDSFRVADAGDSFRDVATADSGSSIDVGSLEAFVVPDALGVFAVPAASDVFVVLAALEGLVVPVGAPSVVRVAEFTIPPACTGAARDAAADVVFAADEDVATGADGDALAAAVGQCEP